MGSEKQGISFRSSMGIASKEFSGTTAGLVEAPRAGSQETLQLLRLAQEISLSASQIVSTEGIFLSVLKRIGTFTGWPIGHVWLPEPSGSLLKPTDLWHLADAGKARVFVEATSESHMGAGEGLAGCAARERRAVWWMDLQQQGKFTRRDAAAAVGIRTGFAFPVFGSRGLVAVFEFFSMQDTPPSETFLEVMAQIATLVGHVFERRDTESRLAWSETLLRRMTDASRLGFCVLDERDESVLYLNQRFREIWGLPYLQESLSPGQLSSEAIAAHCRALVSAASVEFQLFPSENSSREGEITLKDGRAIRYFSASVEGDGSTPLGRMIWHEDVTRHKQVEKKFRDLIESAPDAMVIAGQDGRIVLVNAETERLFGYGREELLGQSMEILVPAEKRSAHAAHRAGFLGNPYARGMGVGLNLHVLRRDGTTFPAEISLSPLSTEEGLMVTATIRDITERRRLERQLSEAVCREQQALGQELHDGLGGTLTGLSLMSKSLHEKLKAGGSHLAEKAREISEASQAALEAARDLAKGLVPVEVEAPGLMAALDDLAQSAASRLGVSGTFVCASSVHVHDGVLATHLFRIAQEALTNAARHGKARHVCITLRADSKDLLLEIEDDGCGFPQDREVRGLGLNTMRHRANVIGGTLQIQSRDGFGTLVRCVVKGWVEDDDPKAK